MDRGLLAPLLLGAIALGLLSCGVPYLERARDPQGWSVMAGMNGNAYSSPSFTGDGTEGSWSFGPFGSVRKTFGDRFSVGLDGSYRFGYTRNLLYKVVFKNPGGEAFLTGKLLLGHSNAIKLDAGGALLYESLTPLGELGYLHDFGEAFTLSVSAGWPHVFGLGLNFHPQASRHFTPHIAGSLEGLGVGWGLGLEWHQEADGNSALSPQPPTP